MILAGLLKFCWI